MINTFQHLATDDKGVVTGTHTTPVKRYVDDVTFKFTDVNATFCAVDVRIQWSILLKLKSSLLKLNTKYLSEARLQGMCVQRKIKGFGQWMWHSWECSCFKQQRTGFESSHQNEIKEKEAEIAHIKIEGSVNIHDIIIFIIFLS